MYYTNQKQNTGYLSSYRKTQKKNQISSPTSKYLQQINQGSVSFNPFQQIQRSLQREQSQHKQIQPQLEFSLIQIKSPTYSDFFNSGGSDKFFQHNQKQRSCKNDKDSLRSRKKTKQLQINLFNANQNPQNEQTVKYENLPNFREQEIRPRSNVYTKIAKTPYIQEVPTFVIKIPQQYREERMMQKKTYRKQKQDEIKEQLKQIYQGKFKIDWGRAKEYN